jgi:hypothetical protein
MSVKEKSRNPTLIRYRVRDTTVVDPDPDMTGYEILNRIRKKIFRIQELRIRNEFGIKLP